MKMYRSFVAVLLAALVLFSCAGCGEKKEQAAAAPATTAPAPTTEPTQPTDEKLVFPAGTKILGTSVEGMEPQQAQEVLTSLIAAYAIDVTVNDKHFTIKAEDVLLTVTLEDITAYAQALAAGRTTAKAPEATLDGALLRQRIAAGTGSSVVDAKVSYSSSAQAFTITKEQSGMSVDTYEASQVIEPAMKKLEPSAVATAQIHEMEPTVKSDDPRLKAAATKANSYLKLSITYVYAPEQVEAKSQAVTKNDIGGMISFDGAMNPYINMTAVNNYAIKMNDKYCVRGKYETPDGVQMSGFGPVLQAVDTQALAADLKGCLEKGISGTRNAPYGKRSENEKGQLTDCVIVNLSAQHLYVYNKSGACVVSTPIVSGCVYNDTETITGVFSIYAKTRNVTLSGPGYSSPVKYWMPFSGGYGLHDANWRSSFGGEIYLYDGSHGCVNIPPAVAGTVYDNVSIGTQVVIYGGTTSVKERPQNLVAVESHKVTPDAEPFDLNVSYLGAPVLSYTSSDPKVATVSQDGKVTVVGVGTTTITVDAPAHAVTGSKPGAYLAGSLEITVTVAYDCTGGHKLTWVTTTEPTCKEGMETGTCGCGHTETRPIAPVKDHAYTTVTVEPTCKEGLKTDTCAGCGDVKTETLPAVKAHEYGEWVTTQAPTCNAEGVQSSTCSGCGDTKTQSVPKDEQNHSFTGGEFCANGCGTADPSYVPPQVPETSPETPEAPDSSDEDAETPKK